MGSPRLTNRPSANRFQACLALETLDSRLSPSLLGGADDESEFMYLSGPGRDNPPQIIDFEAVEVVGGLWRFTGDVVDEFPGGLTVAFGGEPESLQGVTATTDANGHFDKVLLLNTDGSDNGLASAQTADAALQLSNIALYNINPG
jgi:hypothetical protein